MVRSIIVSAPKWTWGSGADEYWYSSSKNVLGWSIMNMYVHLLDPRQLWWIIMYNLPVDLAPLSSRLYGSIRRIAFVANAMKSYHSCYKWTTVSIQICHQCCVGNMILAYHAWFRYSSTIAINQSAVQSDFGYTRAWLKKVAASVEACTECQSHQWCIRRCAKTEQTFECQEIMGTQKCELICHRAGSIIWTICHAKYKNSNVYGRNETIQSLGEPGY